jgi:Xaa-Pro aminopeptidase
MFIILTRLCYAQRRWLNNYNKRIREEVGAELKKKLKMKAFYWMMVKTMTIPETNLDSQDFFPDYSDSTPSTIRQFHVLVVIVAVYHIITNCIRMCN